MSATNSQSQELTTDNTRDTPHARGHRARRSDRRTPGLRAGMLAGMGLLAVSATLGATPAGAAAGAGDTVLRAQAAEPPPIAMELIADRADFPDAISMGLTIGLSGAEPLDLDIEAPSRTAIAKFTIQPGAVFPWHTHPGPVVVNVVQGDLIYVPANDCSEHHYRTGNAFWDPGRGNVHSAYNPTEGVTVIVATFFELPAEGPLSITEGIAAPEGCTVGFGQAAAH